MQDIPALQAMFELAKASMDLTSGRRIQAHRDWIPMSSPRHCPLPLMQMSSISFLEWWFPSS